jgi:hypothetical protein
METAYVAYGLTLRCSFPLPGMIPEQAEGLPVVALELVDAIDLGPGGDDGRPAWRGRLGDGRELQIVRGPADDLNFAYGERARFRFDPATGLLECAPREPADLAWQRVLLSRVLPNVSLAHGREALHASAVESPQGVVAIAAPSETGKSTLAGEMVRRGWPLFADDVLVLADAAAGGVEAHPGTPHVNLAKSATDPVAPGVPGDTLAVLGGERWMTVRNEAPKSREVAAIFLYERGPGLPPAASPLPGSPLDLAPYMLGLPDDVGREGARFALYSDLIESAMLVRLTAGPADGPAAVADALERALDARPAMRGVA